MVSHNPSSGKQGTDAGDFNVSHGHRFGDTSHMLQKVIALASLGVVLSSSHWIKDVRTPAQSNKEEAFIVGVFRTDGVVVPFARYANQKWTNPWPKSADAQADEPSTIADLPKPWYESFVKPPAEWDLSLPAGGTLTVQTSKNIQVCSHCQKVWGLLSDYPNAKPAGRNECVRTLGIALSKKRPAPTMERLTRTSPDWQQLLKFVSPEFDRAENAGLTEASQLYYAQIPRAEERAKIPMSMLNLYRHQLTDQGEVLFYFEVSKEYAKPPEANDAGCNNISLFDGWASRDANGYLTLLDSHFSPTDCDMKEGGRIAPFALMKLDGKTFVVVEEDGYEGESYVIFEIRKDSVHRVLETYAGSC